jgi:hypothetical protein
MGDPWVEKNTSSGISESNIWEFFSFTKANQLSGFLGFSGLSELIETGGYN